MKVIQNSGVRMGDEAASNFCVDRFRARDGGRLAR